MVEVDSRGLQCPEPVMMALAAIKEHPDEEIHVLVSSAIPRDNVERMCKKRGKEVSIAVDGSDFVLTVK